ARKTSGGIGCIQRRVRLGRTRKRQTGNTRVRNIATAPAQKAQLAASRDTVGNRGAKRVASAISATGTGHDTAVLQRVEGEATTLTACNTAAFKHVERDNHIAAAFIKVSARRQVDTVVASVGRAVGAVLGLYVHA